MRRGAWKPPISPLVGEMSGRTEGGAKELSFSKLSTPKSNPQGKISQPNTCPPSSTPPSADCWRCCRPCHWRR
ncbi:hypothetical protein EB233_08855 [Mesorhizobium erdmanii]|uniref:Propionyl-coenzyme A carboxylase alpha polypeptide n=1 Tax=Mesorhizobium erdmanii TaxID=1777866 RepID=A0A6M7UFJ8_9HYPH|nr:hypothetical protein EB233_08855 [Mesorhizobium erdmanii]